MSLRNSLLLALSLPAVALGGCVGGESSPEAIPPPTAAIAARPPPPISGGTLLVAKDKDTIVASDPDRDRIVLASLSSMSVVAELPLKALDEPGRVIEGPMGQVYVALRRGGAVVRIDLSTKQIVQRVEVCGAPRGLAYDAGSIHVACAGGELVTLDAATGAVTRKLTLTPDLRDIVVDGTNLLVSRFRSAEVLRIAEDGHVIDVTAGSSPAIFESAVAWRMVPTANGVAMVHQLDSTGVISTTPGGYGESFCNTGIVNTAVSFLNSSSPSGFTAGGMIGKAALPVDLAFTPDGASFAIIAAGSHSVFTSSITTYMAHANEVCAELAAMPIEEGEPIAVAYANFVPVVQTREPARLLIGKDAMIELGGESMKDAGHYLFHHAPTDTSSMSCASCHPEGRDDGRVWDLSELGPRRTQSVAGGVLATAPLHWDGQLAGFDSLMNDVFTGRMGGEPLSPPLLLAAARWIDSIPLLPNKPVDDAEAVNSVLRGKAIYEDAAVGCTNCHQGPALTNNLSVDVGTGGVFQVPSLRGIAWRAPYMHDGCAPTLRDRFIPGSCGGGDQHGLTSQLTTDQIDDLVHYLETR